MRQPVELIGTIRGTRSGFAFLAPEEGGEDLFVAAAGLNGAIHGDRVRAHLLYRDPYDFRPEVEIDEILERSRPVFSGDVGRAGRSWFVRPDSPLLPERLRLVLGSAPGVAGEKILFRVENRPDRERSLYAVFQEALGDEGDARLDPIIIATEHGLPLRFSDAAIVEAEARVAVTHDPQDARREDFREQFVLTIDPEDAKDFDDAVALERRSDGSFLLAVHIADVSFYIAEGRDLDKEAARRGTSVYFPGSVIPMLPDSVSSVAASLLPGVDRRVMTVLIDLAPDGRRRGARVTRGWIRSAARLDYGWAQAILDGKAEAEGTVTTTLRLMRDLARILRRRRFQRGGFELTVPEAEMRLGKDGVPVSIHRHEVLESHQLIEEFMIAANLATGAWALEREIPFLFRVHQEPDAEALARFEESVLTLMPGVAAGELASLPRLRRWLGRLPQVPLTRIIHRLFLQSVKKAVYAPIDVGHFGLGVRGYCHFTSPIRRYPDLFNHRRLKELLDGAETACRWEDATQLGTLCSRAEVQADEAEREMHRLKSVRYLERRLGDEAEGTVTAATPKGLFVELDDEPVEGFISRGDLPHGTHFARERMTWQHERSGWALRPGDPVRIRIARCDLRTRLVDFVLVRAKPGRTVRGDEAESERARGRGARRRERASGGARGRERDSRSADSKERISRADPREHASRGGGGSGRVSRRARQEEPTRGGRRRSSGGRVRMQGVERPSSDGAATTREASPDVRGGTRRKRGEPGQLEPRSRASGGRGRPGGARSGRTRPVKGGAGGKGRKGRRSR